MVYKPRKDETLTVEDARCVYKNFEGREQKFNTAGDRNFCLLLDDEEVVAQMVQDGWNVKYLTPRDDEELPQPYVQVALGYSPKARPPTVVMISSRGRTNLSEDMVNLLDWVSWERVDLSIRPFDWEVGGRSGRKAYLQQIFVTIQESKLDLKYADVPEASLDTIGEDAV